MRSLVIFLLFSGRCFAAVITGTLSPTSIYPGGTEQAVYDIDNNGVFDFQVLLIHSGGNTYELNITGLNGTVFETNGSYDLIGYNEGVLIGMNTYQNSGVIRPPYFPEYEKKYIGIKFNINGNSHCAYIGVKYTGSDGYELLNYGYDEVPNSCLKAGSTVSTVGINHLESNLHQVMVYPNPVQNYLTFDFKVFPTNTYSVVLKDLNGRVVIKEEFKNNLHTINISTLKRGVYMFEIRGENQSFQIGKILKE